MKTATTDPINSEAQMSNDSAILASSSLFGAHGRFRMELFRDRFGSLVWFVMDAETPRVDGTPEVIRQGESLAQTVLSLPAVSMQEQTDLLAWGASVRP